ncbi:MAG TPA: cation-efflux pump [Anaerolineae bacterium]|nr:cation-efflux pump [Anaerolineae bacterium]HIQ06393.1 cation-efflux pump [Anaerolineae bacterium]
MDEDKQGLDINIRFTGDAGRDTQAIQRVLIITMLLNFMATGLKLGVGFWTGALSLVADGFDTFFDGLSNVVGLVGIYIAARPPDESHPYGHRKFETLAALIIANLLFFTCWELLRSAFERLQGGLSLTVSRYSFLAVLGSVAIQLITSRYELAQGRRLNSEVLVADALHTRASVYVSLAVFGGLLAVRAGFAIADPLLAILVALTIAKIGVDIIRENAPALVDQTAMDPARIAGVVRSVHGVKSFHNIRSRGAAGAVAVDLHVRVSPKKSVQEANAIADEVRRRLLELDGVNDVTVHVEAEREPETSAVGLFATVKLVADELGLTLHECWAHKLDHQLHLEVHVGVNPQLTLGQAHTLVERMEREALHRLPQVTAIHTHIEPASAVILPGEEVPPQLLHQVEQAIDQAVTAIPNLSHPHAIAVRRSEGKLFIALECAVPGGLSVTHAHDLSTELEARIAEQLGDAVAVLVHLEPAETSRYSTFP